MNFLLKNNYIILLVAFSSLSTAPAWGQDKIFLRCDGAATAGTSDQKNITNSELKAFVKLKPMSLIVTINANRIAINDNYEFKNIDSIFPDSSSGYLLEHGHLDVKDTYYDGYYNREKYGEFKDSTDNLLDKKLYLYQHMRFRLNRLDGDFYWSLTHHGNNSWLNDLLTVTAKEKYVNLIVEGKCKKQINNVLF